MGYYRNNYKRPHYNRRSRYYRHGSSSKFPVGKIFIIVCAVFLFLIALSSGQFFVWAIIVGVIALAVKGVRKLFGEDGQSDASDATQINSEKHGCKCYMEGLSDGEQEVADILSRELSYKDYFIFNNLIIPSENNRSTQIDHIVVSKFGIFVIESKDYNGWIFGDKDQPFWTQSLPGSNKFQFQNPIRQNYAHIMALKVLMPLAVDSFCSIVVFSDKSEIKTTPIENVVHLNQLIDCIRKYTQEKLTRESLQLAIGKLSYACQTVDITASEHIENLQAHQPA